MGARTHQLRLRMDGATVQFPAEVQTQATQAMARLLRQVLGVEERPALPAGERREGDKHDDA